MCWQFSSPTTHTLFMLMMMVMMMMVQMSCESVARWLKSATHSSHQCVRVTCVHEMENHRPIIFMATENDKIVMFVFI